MASCALLVLMTMVLLLCSRAVLSFESDHGVPCSREKSRMVRQMLRESVYAVVNQEAPDFEWPNGCPIAYKNDRFLAQDNGRERIRRFEWRCNLCNKTFRNEKYLDLHLDRKHQDSITPTSTCFADFCDMLGGCDASSSKLQSCKPSEMARLQNVCNAIIHKCFDPDKGGIRLKLHDIITKNLCDPLTCARANASSSSPTASKGGSVWWWVLTMVVAMFMLAFYVGMYLWSRETSVGKDLDKLRASRHKSRLAWFQSKKKLF